jgi:hypothetical protein
MASVFHSTGSSNDTVIRKILIGNGIEEVVVASYEACLCTCQWGSKETTKSHFQNSRSESRDLTLDLPNKK